MDNEFELGQQIARLQGTIDEGFKGIHLRQDITNGRVGKCETRLTKLENDSSHSNGEQEGRDDVWAKVATVISIVIAILAIIFK